MTGDMGISYYNPDITDEEWRAVLKEVKDHIDLLKQFEGVVPDEELSKRKQALYLALPPVPPPASGSFTAGGDGGSGEGSGIARRRGGGGMGDGLGQGRRLKKAKAAATSAIHAAVIPALTVPNLTVPAMEEEDWGKAAADDEEEMPGLKSTIV